MNEHMHNRNTLRDSILAMTSDLVAARSQTGLDSAENVARCVHEWALRLGLSVEPVPGPDFPPLAFILSTGGWQQGRVLCLNACADTAPAGDRARWATDPFQLTRVGDSYFGRGAADSKVAVALFAHLVAQIGQPVDGRAAVALIDFDEHSGRFEGLGAWLRNYAGITDGIYIGYPGADEIKIGARGLIRIKCVFSGEAHHSGSSTLRPNPVYAAARMATALKEMQAGAAQASFPLPGRIEVTALHAGEAFGMTPSSAQVYIDARTVPGWDADGVQDAITKLALAQGCPATCELVAKWPPYALRSDHWLVVNLLAAARSCVGPVRLGLSGPSNIGNLAAMYSVPATCGFGVRHTQVHSPDEGFDASSLVPAFDSYSAATRAWLSAGSR